MIDRYFPHSGSIHISWKNIFRTGTILRCYRYSEIVHKKTFWPHQLSCLNFCPGQVAGRYCHTVIPTLPREKDLHPHLDFINLPSFLELKSWYKNRISPMSLCLFVCVSAVDSQTLRTTVVKLLQGI